MSMRPCSCQCWKRADLIRARAAAGTCISGPVVSQVQRYCAAVGIVVGRLDQVERLAR